MVMFRGMPGERVDIGKGGGESKVNVNVFNYSGEQVKTSERDNPEGGKDITVTIGQAMRAVAQDEIMRQLRPGGMLS
jgi:hypothetical protein